MKAFASLVTNNKACLFFQSESYIRLERVLLVPTSLFFFIHSFQFIIDFQIIPFHSQLKIGILHYFVY